MLLWGVACSCDDQVAAVKAGGRIRSSAWEKQGFSY